ncbi:MAG: IS1595 family transposase [Eubacterium sp.]|nr:IS1595 family transposase [Eubacterium sp.]
MSELKEVITSYNNLSFCDRIVFYTTISNDITITDDVQSFLIDTRFEGDCSCIYCEGTQVVKNGKRKDGVQRFLCRDCHRSFIASSDSITSRTRKSVSVWTAYLRCMLDQKTLKQTSEECNISMSTAFTWRHKILDALGELTEKAYLTGIVEVDETFFNVSFKGNHKRSHNFIMPREARKRGNDVHTKGLSSEKVCVPCAINDTGISYARPGKLGKISSDCITAIFENKIAPHAILCTDNERAYLNLAGINQLNLIQMDTDCRTIMKKGAVYGIQRIPTCHRLIVIRKTFTDHAKRG